MTMDLSSNGDQGRASSNFSERLVDLFFRRWLAYTLPVLLFTAIGAYTASTQADRFSASGTLSASANPLVGTPAIRTTGINDFESPAAGSARLINEQLRTNAFVDTVVEQAGLADALAAGLIDRDEIRRNVLAFETGQNFLKVEATWGDPATSVKLVNATVSGYLEYVDEIVTGDSADAIQFLTSQKTQDEVVLNAAKKALNDYVRVLPELAEGVRQPTEVELELSRLSGAVTLAEGDVNGTERAITTAQLAVDQAQSAAGRQLRVVDDAQIPTSPTAGRIAKLLPVIMFTILGLMIMSAALVIGTLTERTVRLRRELGRLARTDMTVVVPNLKSIRAPGAKRKKAA